MPESADVQHAIGSDKVGDALKLTPRESPVLFLHGNRNAAYAASNWQ